MLLRHGAPSPIFFSVLKLEGAPWIYYGYALALGAIAAAVDDARSYGYGYGYGYKRRLQHWLSMPVHEPDY